MLAVVMPGSLLVTWLWKQYEIMTPRSRWQVADEWPVPQDEVDIRRIVYYAPPVPSCDDDERAALRRIGWWNETSDNCCRWKGIKCSQGRITKVTFAAGKLRGTLPNELARLSQLQVLDLNENPSLSGTLPEQLGRLDSLSNVYLFGSRLSGSLPDSLGGCAALQELELSHCRLSGTLPASLGRASKLQYLFFESNALSGTLPASLGRLRGLKELELSENRLSGSVPSALRSRSLSHLDLQKNPRLKGVPQASAKSQCSGGSDKYLRGPGLQQSTEADKPSAIQASKSVAKSLPAADDGTADGEGVTAGGQPGKGQG